jgi:RNA polymerase sigma-70 factor (ECF subfamily)
MVKGADHDDATVIKGFLAGEKWACAQIDHWILSVLRSRHWNLATHHEDIHQDVLVRLVEALSGFEGRSSLKTYVCRIAMYTSIDVYRRERRLTFLSEPIDELDIPDPAPGPLKQLEAVERKEILKRLVMRASAECRDLWRMVYFERLPYHRIAGRMGVEVGTVKSRASRCREKARRVLQDILKSRNLNEGLATI